ncbi:uncharacterized protein [Antedon mediterranea]|uniref:uncharacterized protein n=1 Tax=Antedon mediterranea TaxID=105859 RepID=UPI003AF7CD19
MATTTVRQEITGRSDYGHTRATMITMYNTYADRNNTTIGNYGDDKRQQYPKRTEGSRLSTVTYDEDDISNRLKSSASGKAMVTHIDNATKVSTQQAVHAVLMTTNARWTTPRNHTLGQKQTTYRQGGLDTDNQITPTYQVNNTISVKEGTSTLKSSLNVSDNYTIRSTHAQIDFSTGPTTQSHVTSVNTFLTDRNTKKTNATVVSSTVKLPSRVSANVTQYISTPQNISSRFMEPTAETHQRNIQPTSESSVSNISIRGESEMGTIINNISELLTTPSYTKTNYQQVNPYNNTGKNVSEISAVGNSKAKSMMSEPPVWSTSSSIDNTVGATDTITEHNEYQSKTTKGTPELKSETENKVTNNLVDLETTSNQEILDDKSTDEQYFTTNTDVRSKGETPVTGDLTTTQNPELLDSTSTDGEHAAETNTDVISSERTPVTSDLTTTQNPELLDFTSTDGVHAAETNTDVLSNERTPVTSELTTTQNHELLNFTSTDGEHAAETNTDVISKERTPVTSDLTTIQNHELLDFTSTDGAHAAETNTDVLSNERTPVTSELTTTQNHELLNFTSTDGEHAAETNTDVISKERTPVTSDLTTTQNPELLDFTSTDSEHAAETNTDVISEKETPITHPLTTTQNQEILYVDDPTTNTGVITNDGTTQNRKIYATSTVDKHESLISVKSAFKTTIQDSLNKNDVTLTLSLSPAAEHIRTKTSQKVTGLYSTEEKILLNTHTTLKFAESYSSFSSKEETTSIRMKNVIKSTARSHVTCSSEQLVTNILSNDANGPVGCKITDKSIAESAETIEREMIEMLHTSSTDYISIKQHNMYGIATLISKERSNISLSTGDHDIFISFVNATLMSSANMTAVVSYMKPDNDNVDPSQIVWPNNSSSVGGDYSIIGGVISITLYTLGVKTNAPVKFKVHRTITESLDEALSEREMCTFFSLNQSLWSTSGCTTTSSNEYVNCVCSHMTSFAVLMQVSSKPKEVHLKQLNKPSFQIDETHGKIINVITSIGLSLSLASLVITLTLYIVLPGLWKSLRNNIHKHLIGNMIVFYLVFLVGLENVYNEGLCKFTAVLLHFELQNVFMWMSAEAIYLVFKVVCRTPSKYNKLRNYLCMCYIGSFTMVSLTIAINMDCYGTQNLCWLKRSCRWAVVIPPMLIVLLNTGVLLKMVYIIYTRTGSMTRQNGKKRSTIGEKDKQIRTAVKGSLLLLPVLGISWILGPFVDGDNLVVTYLFVIINSLQGVFIFIAYCLCDKDVKEAYIKFKKRRLSKNQVNASFGETETGNSSSLFKLTTTSLM